MPRSSNGVGGFPPKLHEPSAATDVDVVDQQLPPPSVQWRKKAKEARPHVGRKFRPLPRFILSKLEQNEGKVDIGSQMLTGKRNLRLRVQLRVDAAGESAESVANESETQEHRRSQVRKVPNKPDIYSPGRERPNGATFVAYSRRRRQGTRKHRQRTTENTSDPRREAPAPRRSHWGPQAGSRKRVTLWPTLSLPRTHSMSRKGQKQERKSQKPRPRRTVLGANTCRLVHGSSDTTGRQRETKTETRRKSRHDRRLPTRCGNLVADQTRRPVDRLGRASQECTRVFPVKGAAALSLPNS